MSNELVKKAYTELSGHLTDLRSDDSTLEKLKALGTMADGSVGACDSVFFLRRRQGYTQKRQNTRGAVFFVLFICLFTFLFVLVPPFCFCCFRFSPPQFVLFRVLFVSSFVCFVSTFLFVVLATRFCYFVCCSCHPFLLFCFPLVSFPFFPFPLLRFPPDGRSSSSSAASPRSCIGLLRRSRQGKVCWRGLREVRESAARRNGSSQHPRPRGTATLMSARPARLNTPGLA